MTGSVPMPTRDEAKSVGEALRDHFVRLAGFCPLPGGDLGLADMVRILANIARERVAGRQEA